MSIATIKQLATHVFSTLGSGFSESVYGNALAVMLRLHNIPYEQEVIIPIQFEGHNVGNTRADFIIEKTLIVELKAVTKTMDSAEMNQLLMYQRLTGINRGLLINFHQKTGKDIVFLESTGE